MSVLKGSLIYLRALEPSDLSFLYSLENDTSIWELSGTQTPYSKKVLTSYLENAHFDIYQVKQLRLCICDNSKSAILGLVDIFDFDPKNRRAGMGIIIVQPGNRRKGFGREAIHLVCNYAFNHLLVHQLYANILAENEPSIALFESLDFKKVGVKTDWIYDGRSYKDEILYQKIAS